jgi:4-amino-4-deoxy-L-arabinose transferase-like glycosyltransferase
VKAARYAAWVVGIALAVWAALDPRFRDAEGFLQTRVLLPFAGAVAAPIVGAALGRAWQAAGLWLGLAVLGQAASLQLIEAGSGVGYQHYSLVTAAPGPGAIPYLIVGIQMLAVALGLRPVLRRITGWLVETHRPLGLAVAAAAVVLSAAALSRDPLLWAGETALATLVQLINLANIIVFAAALPPSTLRAIGAWPGDARSTADGDHGHRARDRVPLLAALWVLVVSTILVLVVYERHPHVPDEVVYLYHARYFAAGMLSIPAPPVPSAFEIDLMTYEATRWFSPVPPGWPATLALGVFLGVGWLVNPVLAALAVLLTYYIVDDLYDRPTARVAVLLLAASPWLLFLAMSYMTHTVALTGALAAAAALVRTRRTGRTAWALAGGAAIGLVGLTRPLEGLAVALLLGVCSLWIRGRRFRLGPSVALTLGALAVGSVVLPYNNHLAGSPTRFPLMDYTDQRYGPGSNALGFGPERGLGWSGLDPFPGHGPADVVVNSALNTYAINVELLGWSVGSLLVIALFLVGRARLTRSDGVMLAVILTIVALHSLYWFSGGPDFGARYWYLVIVPCIVLAARGVQWLARGGEPSRVHLAVLALCLVAVVTFLPWRAIDKYHHYRGMRPEVRELARRNDFGRSLVLVRGENHPDYASAAFYNPLRWDADAPIYAWNRSPDVARRVLDAYPDRTVWIVDGPSVTGAGYRVVAGPVDPDRREGLAQYLTPAAPDR